jgi:hypothetical protein
MLVNCEPRKAAQRGGFLLPKSEIALAFQCWVSLHLTAHDITQIMHAHTIHVAVVGVLALARSKLSKPKD